MLCAIVMLKFAVAAFAGELESVTLTVNEEVSAVVGTPVMSPLVLSAKPVGNAPDETVQVYGVLPPPAYRKAE